MISIGLLAVRAALPRRIQEGAGRERAPHHGLPSRPAVARAFPRPGRGRAAPADGEPVLRLEQAAQLLRRLTDGWTARVRVFAADGGMALDSRTLAGPGGAVEVRALPPPGGPNLPDRIIGFLLALFDGAFHRMETLEPYREAAVQRAADYAEVEGRAQGNPRGGGAFAPRRRPDTERRLAGAAIQAGRRRGAPLRRQHRDRPCGPRGPARCAGPVRGCAPGHRAALRLSRPQHGRTDPPVGGNGREGSVRPGPTGSKSPIWAGATTRSATSRSHCEG